jgi:hypothetical protein
VPSLNPFLNRRVMDFMYRIRPVPSERRRLAFSPQLYWRIFFAGYPQELQTLFWMWYDTLPHRRQVVWVLVCRSPKEVVPFVCWEHKEKETNEIDPVSTCVSNFQSYHQLMTSSRDPSSKEYLSSQHTTRTRCCLGKAVHRATSNTHFASRVHRVGPPAQTHKPHPGGQTEDYRFHRDKRRTIVYRGYCQETRAFRHNATGVSMGEVNSQLDLF